MYQQRKKDFGFSLIELLLVIALISILGVAGSAIGQKFLVSNHLKNKTNELTYVLRTAQLNSMSGKENSQWGVNVTNNQIILFKGDSYLSRDTAFDMIFSIPGSLSVTNDEVIFSRITGEPDTIAAYVISTNAGNSQTVVVNEVGVINVN